MLTDMHTKLTKKSASLQLSLEIGIYTCWVYGETTQTEILIINGPLEYEWSFFEAIINTSSFNFVLMCSV